MKSGIMLLKMPINPQIQGCEISRNFGCKFCLKCKGQMLACAEGLEKQLIRWVKSDEEKTRDRMMKNAQAVANRGMDANSRTNG